LKIYSNQHFQWLFLVELAQLIFQKYPFDPSIMTLGVNSNEECVSPHTTD